MSVVAARGFQAAGLGAGIKPEGLDLAVVLAHDAVPTAGVFTGNAAAAAPVLVSRGHLATGRHKRGVALNSGCANAATGKGGYENAVGMTSTLAAAAGGSAEEYLVCSTGTIGPQLPMGRVVEGIRRAASVTSASPDAGTDAARAIMTTDSVPKESVVRGDGWTIGGMAKGAGMVRPDMATMLAVITTDVALEAEMLQDALHRAVDGSFNSLNIDGCESTNDTVIAMASGTSGISPDAEEFSRGLGELCRDLAIQMARDAEGASRMVTIDVTGAVSDTDARQLGRLVADSALVRASFYGGDVNWGRILGAMGSSKMAFDVDAVSITYDGVVVFVDGEGCDFDEASLLQKYETGDLALGIDLGAGSGSASIVTTDLTPEYVVFNGERS